jgi:hypothetical protein
MSNKNPLINVVTRTSGRPEFFKRNVNSINSQTYKNIRHVIITDSKDNVSYIKNNGIEEYYIYDPIYLVKNDKTKDPKTGRLSAHNLYFNSKYKDFAMWDKWKCSDFRVISKLHNKIPNKVCIVEPFVKVPLAGKGERNDLK